MSTYDTCSYTCVGVVVDRCDEFTSDIRCWIGVGFWVVWNSHSMSCGFVRVSNKQYLNMISMSCNDRLDRSDEFTSDTRWWIGVGFWVGWDSHSMSCGFVRMSSIKSYWIVLE